MAAHLFERLDTDQNGELSREEFAVQHEIRQKLHKERHQQRRFDRLDADDDSQITLDEFQQRLEKMRALDSDANGFVSRAELRRGMNERRSSLRRLDKRTDS